MLSEKNNLKKINFLVEKVYTHHWPPETPKWNNSRKIVVDKEINNNKEKKEITINEKNVQINNYLFDSIKKLDLLFLNLKDKAL